MNSRTASSRVKQFSAAAFVRQRMNGKNESEADKIWNGLYPRIYFLIRKNKRRWESIAACFGLSGGLLSLIVGVVCDISARCLTSDNSVAILKKASVAAFFLCLPLMIFGAHCLDLLETKYFND